MPDATHKRKPRICGVMSASGPGREMLACAYKPGHKGDHSWASLPTFPLPKDVVIGEVTRLMMERYGGFVDFPADARDTLSWLVDTFLGPGEHSLPSITKPVKPGKAARVPRWVRDA